MGNVTFTAALGRPFFEGASDFRTKDDSSDNKASGVYSHVAGEFAATEAAEWLSFFVFLIDRLRSGVAGIACRNETGDTLAKGTLVCISGYSAANSAFLIVKADYANAAQQALFVLDTAILTAANGTAYAAALVTGLNTAAASAVGSPVYAGAAGAWTLTAPTLATQILQEVGRVTIKDGSNGAIAFYPGLRFVQRITTAMLPPA